MTEPARPGVPRPRWWEGVASPGPGGYAVAVVVSLLVLGVLGAVVEPLVADGETVDRTGTFLGVVLFGTVFALVLGPPGVLLVHLLTLRVRPQWVHVVVTALVGGAAGLLVLRDLEPFVPMMALATGAGRAAVVPLVPGVRRRRLARSRAGAHDADAPQPARPADFDPTAPPG